MGVSEHRQFDERDKELERLHQLVRDLELEVRDRRRRRNCDDREEGSTSGGGHYRVGSHQSELHQHWEHSRSQEYADRFPQKGDGPGMLLWMLCAEPYAELVGRHFQIILNGPQC